MNIEPLVPNRLTAMQDDEWLAGLQDIDLQRSQTQHSLSDDALIALLEQCSGDGDLEAASSLVEL